MSPRMPICDSAGHRPHGSVIPRVAVAILLLLVAVRGVSAPDAPAAPATADQAMATTESATRIELSLAPSARVDASGVFLDQLVSVTPATTPLPHVRLTNAPAFGRTTELSRRFVEAALRQHAQDLVTTHWSGPETVQISRRSRALEETELCELLTAATEAEVGGDEGELELRLARPWTPLVVPDDPLTVLILDFPTSGLRPFLLVRFDLLSGEERLGGWHLTFRANYWKEIPVARSTLQRGVRVVDADITLERVDVLAVRDPLGAESLEDPHLELAQTVRAGSPVLARAVRVRPVIRRGGLVEGLMDDGLMMITLKVEALEDALPGQTFRVRNPRNRREYLAQAQDAQTVLLLL